MQDKLRERAKELLESGAVQVFIGYGEGMHGGVRPVFIRKGDDAGKLVFDERCVQNLAGYLMKPEVRALGSAAIVATPGAMRALRQLAAENQFTGIPVRALGMTAEGVIVEFDDFEALSAYVAEHPHEIPPPEKERLKKIQRMSVEARWAFWNEKFSECIKCYACRASCSLCYCSRCTTECNQPQWISPASHQLGNFEWHVMRAMHLAGRCVDCGECYRACPLDIPLHLLTMYLSGEIRKNFGSPGGKDYQYPLSTYAPADKDDFIR